MVLWPYNARKDCHQGEGRNDFASRIGKVYMASQLTDAFARKFYYFACRLPMCVTFVAPTACRMAKTERRHQ